MTYAVVRATYEHARQVAADMRPMDIMEARSIGMGPLEAIEMSMEQSYANWTWLVDDRPAAIGGVYLLSALGCVAGGWLFTTGLVDKHPVAFARMTMRMKEAVTSISTTLVGHVHAEHPLGLRWAKFLGMSIAAPQPYGPHQAPYCEIRHRETA